MQGKRYFEHAGLLFQVPKESHLHMIAALRNEFGTWTQLTDPRPVGIFDQKAWFESLGKERYAFVVEHEVEAIGMVGFVRLDEYDAVNRSVRVGADVVPEHRHRGYGTRIY